MVFSARLPFCQVALKNSESRPSKNYLRHILKYV